MTVYGPAFELMIWHYGGGGGLWVSFVVVVVFKWDKCVISKTYCIPFAPFCSDQAAVI